MTQRFTFQGPGGDEVIDARDVGDAIDEYVRSHDGEGWSDHFDVTVRCGDDARWRVFSVSTHTELVVEVNGSRWGELVGGAK